MRTLCWAWLLLTIVIYIFTLFAMKMLADYRDDPDMKPYFGNVFIGMFTIFQCITTEGWVVIADTTMDRIWWMWIFFLLVLVTCTFAILNVVLGVVVESTVEAAKSRQGDIAAKMRKEHELACRKIYAVFYSLDADVNGMLSKAEFRKAFKNPVVEVNFLEMGIDSNFAEGMFDILDIDGSGVLDSKEFVTGVMRSRGEAMNKDLLAIRCDIWRISLKLHKEMKEARELLRANAHRQRMKLRKMASDVDKIAHACQAMKLGEGSA